MHTRAVRAAAPAAQHESRGHGPGLHTGSGGLGLIAGRGTNIYSKRIANTLQARRSFFSHASVWVGLALIAMLINVTSASVAFVLLVMLDMAMFMRKPDLTGHLICLRCGHTWAPHGARVRRTIAP